MPILVYPKSAAEVVATLIEFFEHQGKNALAETLRASQSRIEHTDSNSNWNGGTEYFTLFLELPVKLFAPIEPKLEEFEEAIQTKFGRVFRDEGNLVLSRAVLTAAPSESRSLARRITANDGMTSDVWDVGFLRLFLSHVSAHKVATMKLKLELRHFGVSCFVAHEDIDPSLEWQNEIEKALGSMDALAALLTTDFHPSKWTDQEVGIALGRGVLVAPIGLGILPYGFIGKQQALRGDLGDVETLATKIVDVLSSHTQTAEKMRESLVVALERAPSYAASRAVSYKLVATEGFTSTQLNRIEEACVENRQVKESTNVVPRISRFLEKFRPKPSKPAPSEDDDVPF